MSGFNSLVGGADAGTFGIGVTGFDPGAGRAPEISDYMGTSNMSKGGNQITVAGLVIGALAIVIALHASGFRAMVAVG